MNAAFEWSPFLPLVVTAVLAVAGLLAFLAARLRGVPDFLWRGIFFLLLAFLILNPVILNEIRQGLPDKLVIVVDESASQKIGGRDKVAEEALSALQKKLEQVPGVDPVVIRAGHDSAPGKGESTNLFTALRNGLSSIPLPQVAGTVFITDGQVHDVPQELGMLEKIAPFHVILTGKKDETDRKVTIVSAPKYGLLSEDVKISVKVDEFGKPSPGGVRIIALQDGKSVGDDFVQPGEVKEYTFRLTHPGQNIFEFTTPAQKDELTDVNNTAPVIVNGVRDRLRVLLVSGAPHMGERAWRNLLKSDPSIDLVHFTILRSLSSVDSTPQKELSLIVFPVEELFQRKLKDFDLVIFDRYRQFSLLMPQYFLNLASYIKEGGAFLLAMGSDEADDAIFRTALADALPVEMQPGAEAVKQAYTPTLTDLGKNHPVTGDLRAKEDTAPWGQWFSQTPVSQLKGQTLMTGVNGQPLLVLDKVTDGRVAVLASDNVWLWSKGAETSGPYTRLLRNVAHWLMKEPELEDDYIKAEVRGNTITVSQRNLNGGAKSVLMTKPSGEEQTVALDTPEQSWATAKIQAEQNGIYSFEADGKKAFAVVGTALNEEFADVHTTAEKLAPIVEKTGGGIVWFQDERDFSLRGISASARHAGGEGWIGVKRREAYAVSTVESRGLVPNPLALLVIMVAALWMWRREGRA